MATFLPVQAQPFSLAGAGVTIGDTSITLKTFAQIDGTLLTMADFGSKGYVTLEPGNGTLEEQASFTGVTQNTNGTATLTGVSNVTFVSPYTETSGLSKTHAGSTLVVLSNTAGYYTQFVSVDNTQTVLGIKTFTDPQVPRMDAQPTYIAGQEKYLATKGYADSLTFAGAPNASTTQKGIVQLSTQTQADARTTAGSTGALLVNTPELARSTLLSDYKLDTGAANAYVITPVPTIAAYTTGQIFSFKAANTNTTASTLNVNAMGATAIKKATGSTALDAGDITAGQIILVEYDGTNFQMLSPVPTNTIPTGSVQMYAGASAPSSWLFCDASAVSRTTYAALFAVISTTYGVGDGSTTFNVPDMRGRVPIGVGTGTGGGSSGTGLPSGGSALTARSRASWLGEETHTMTQAELVAHSHTFPGSNTGGSGASVLTATGGTVTVTSTGSTTPFNEMQPSMGLNFIIKI